MAIYPLEFYRRAEEKWRRRSESVRAAVTGSPSKKEGHGCSQSGKDSSPNTLY
jgi:hypothetical protein